MRGCGLPLRPATRLWNCAANHTFDVARSGYLNLLQPQDKRSPRAGDPVAAIDARTRLLKAGVGAGLLNRLAAVLPSLAPDPNSVIVELGCGGGELLGRLDGTCADHTIGIDLATAAVDRAAKAWPTRTWIVANADRQLPLLDGRVDVVVSVHARRNAMECARVLRPGGVLVVAVPAPDDLVELREAVLGRRVERQRTDQVTAEHQTLFALDEQFEHREQLALTASQLSDLLTGTYRGERTAAHAPRAALVEMLVTLASDVLIFRRT